MTSSKMRKASSIMTSSIKNPKLSKFFEPKLKDSASLEGLNCSLTPSAAELWLNKDSQYGQKITFSGLQGSKTLKAGKIKLATHKC